MTHWVSFGSREEWLAIRREVVTSTEMPALCGISKYGQTPYSLYHKKRGELSDDIEPSDRMEAGTYLEAAIGKYAAAKLKCRLRKVRDFARLGSLGATPDYEITTGPRKGWLMEVKNVDGLIFRSDWTKDEHGRPVAPDHIIIQTQMQLACTGRPGSVLAVLVGGNDLKLVELARDEKMIGAFEPIAAKFLERVRDGSVPPVQGGDSQHVLALYRGATPGKIVEADAHTNALLTRWDSLKEQEKEVKAELDEVKAQILLNVGDAEKVIGSSYTLNCSMTAGSAGTKITPEMVGSVIGAKKGHRQFLVKERK